MMKKIFYYIAAAVLSLGVESCAKEAAQEHPVNTEGARQISVWAQIDDEATTKTALSGNDAKGYTVLWSEGDEITVADGWSSTFTLVEGAGTTRGRFVGTSEAGDGTYDVFYAASVATNYKSLRSTSQYNGDKDISSAPMAAKITISNGEATITDFKNLCGLLRLTLKGSGTVKEIRIYASQALYGNFDILPDGSASITSSPYLEYITQTSASGVPLSSSGTDFYFSLPPKNYSDVRIEVSDFAGHTFTKTLKADKTLNITRAKITPVVLTVTGLTNDYMPLTWESPVGTVGMLDGRECMVVDLGDGIGKMAVATKNVGASSATESGDFIPIYTAVHTQDSNGWGKGWRMMTFRESEAFIALRHKSKAFNYTDFYITDKSTIRIPCTGYQVNDRFNNTYYTFFPTTNLDYNATKDDSYPHHKCSYVISTTDRNDSYNFLKSIGVTIRPVHRLPITANTPVGAIGYLDGREAIVAELDMDGVKQKVAIDIRNVGANTEDGYCLENNGTVKYLDCFGTYFLYQEAIDCVNNMEGQWYIPSFAEWKGLINNYSYSYNANGFESTVVFSQHKTLSLRITESSRLYLQAAGSFDTKLNFGGERGFYWSSTGDRDKAYMIWFNSNEPLFEYKTKQINPRITLRLFHEMPK